MKSTHRLIVLCCAFLVLAGCGKSGDDTVVDVAFIGSTDAMFDNSQRLAPVGQEIRAATSEGLVAMDEFGEVVPALAERWIVTEDGLSYIFRLRDSQWPDGTPITGQNVRNEMQRNLRALRGTSLGLDLAKISEIIPMTGRVIEIRLDSPMPQFLQLLAQPELGLRRSGQGTGPMRLQRTDDIAVLDPLPPQARGLPFDENWESRVRQVRVHAFAAPEAVDAFNKGIADIVMNGTLASLPLADTGPLSRGTVRLDGTLGLFGIQIMHDTGLLSEATTREAIAMAIDRENLLAPFNIGGWVPTTRIVAPDLPSEFGGGSGENSGANSGANAGGVGERWTGLSLEQRQAQALRRIGAAARTTGGASLSIALPVGPGSDLLFRELAGDLAAIGVRLVRAKAGEKADLVLVDRLARYADARWFLNQFNCSLKRGLCSAEADALIAEAGRTSDALQTAALLAQAEAQLTSINAFIPLGAPIRWSLVRGNVDGFSENRWGLHPLFPMALRPM
ncbi:peptide ABC transporter substrate-binding protein [Altererythrobacter confluentis]|uniref:Peptide ABC transporter substrate-binding protein n=1 Tax=Allopontixanthobacter confluentis TaxID=1849021 RepID=A0A6L7GHF8_9SPHN|nr:ABC transporter substrate-binding protein [Allopontixanthobacter confluentis]MXP15010.1 peptide ABC transporter substrate-binding protein [Allopontixanthobacter confluentis]